MDDNEDEWRGRAACIGVDTEIFFPVHRNRNETAMAICAGCPVRTECLTAALDEEGPITAHGISYGIRGGKTADARRVMLLGTQVGPGAVG